MASNLLLHLVALAALVSVAPIHAAPSAHSAQAYRTACADLEQHRASGFWIDDTPQGVQALSVVWETAGAWVADDLDAQRDVGVDAVNAALRALAQATPHDDTEFPGAIALPDGAFLASLPACFGGTVVVFARVDGRYRVVWSTGTGTAGPSLSAWHADHAQEHGRADARDRGRAGPLHAALLARLPDDAQGRARFVIDAGYAQAAGATVGAQVSVWRWDGTRAQALVVRDYAYTYNQPVGVRLEGALLKVRQKQEFRTFFDCGACLGRQVEWTLRLTPQGVQDLGETSVVPELDAIDELISRVIRRRPTRDVASEAAVATAREMVAAARRHRSPKEWAGYPTLGMLALPEIGAPLDADVLRFGIYDLGFYDVVFRRSASGIFIASIRQVADD